MGKDYGEPIRYDPNFSGPTRNRSCTDILWLIVFIIFLGGWGYVGYYGVTRGSVEKLLAPIDSKGRRCGLDSGLEDKKYLVFFNITKCLAPGTPITGCPTPQVCVKKCPDRTIIFEKEFLLNPASFEQLKQNMVCTDEVTNIDALTLPEAIQLIKAEKCANYVLQSQQVLFRCVGDLSALACDGVSSLQDRTTCLRDPKSTQKSVDDFLNTFDAYVGWFTARLITFFTRNEKDVKIVVLGRCFVNVTAAVEVIKEISDLNLEEGQVTEQFSKLLKLNQISSQIVQDLHRSRWYLLGALGAVVVLCFIYILLLRWVVGPVVWVSIAGLFALIVFAMYLCYNNYVYYKANVGIYQQSNLKGVVQSIFGEYQTWLVLLIILGVIFVILLLVMIFLRKRISIAIALIREGSKAVSANKTTILFPIFPWIFQCAVIGYAVLVLMHLLSIGDSSFQVVNKSVDINCHCGGIYEKDGEPCEPVRFWSECRDAVSQSPCANATCHYSGVTGPHYVVYLHLANALGFFWAMFFISGVADMTLASTFSTWYWTFRKKDLPFFTLTSAIYTTIRYHLGTVAFGALIIAIVRVIRVILEYIDHKVKKFDNTFTRAILCCCRCFFWCLESFLKFINKNAYIMCAIHGKNFCKSANDAFSLLMRNVVRLFVLDKVADWIFFMSKLAMSVGVGFAVYYLVQSVGGSPPLHYPQAPAVVLGVATYLVCSVFFNVYSVAVDTLFLCFLEDCERNDGSPEKPYYMSKSLMKILHKRNKKVQ